MFIKTYDENFRQTLRSLRDGEPERGRDDSIIRLVQITLSKLEDQTGLAFPEIVHISDVLKPGAPDRSLRSFSDIKHPRR